MSDATSPSGDQATQAQDVTISADELRHLHEAWQALREHVDAHHAEDEDLRAHLAQVEYALYPQRFVTGVQWHDPDPRTLADRADALERLRRYAIPMRFVAGVSAPTPNVDL